MEVPKALQEHQVPADPEDYQVPAENQEDQALVVVEDVLVNLEKTDLPAHRVHEGALGKVSV